MKPRRILVVDDEPGIRQSLSGALEDDGYSVEAVENGEACLEALGRAEFELVLLDIWLPGMDGMEVLSRVQEIPFAERPLVVMISGHANIEGAVKATKLGAFDFLEKPLSLEKISVAVKNALDHRRTDRKRAVRTHQGQLHGRGRGQDREISEGRQRHALSGRSGRHEPAHPSQGVARARRAAI